MAWKLEIKTKDGDRHTVRFDTKEDAEAALAEVTPRVGRAGNVTIAGQLVVVAAHIMSVKIYEESGPLIA